MLDVNKLAKGDRIVIKEDEERNKINYTLDDFLLEEIHKTLNYESY